jgi:ribosome biogenesis ATPase
MEYILDEFYVCCETLLTDRCICHKTKVNTSTYRLKNISKPVKNKILNIELNYFCINHIEYVGIYNRLSPISNEDINSKKKIKDQSLSSMLECPVLGGIDDVLDNIREIIQFPLIYPEVYEWLGVTPTSGVLLYGPSGCGKTSLVNVLAKECRTPLLKISATEIIVGVSGESEKKIRSLFSDAMALAPSIIFIDEIETLTTKRENAQRETEKRIVTQIMKCMDELSSAQHRKQQSFNHTSSDSSHVVVLGATNHPEWIDPAFRRTGRFDREIELGLPTEKARKKILEVICRNLRLDHRFDHNHLAKQTPGFAGADLVALTKEAATSAIKRTFKNLNIKEFLHHESCSTCKLDLSKIFILKIDFDIALSKVQPNIKRDGFTAIPEITWSDVGYLEEIRNELNFSITLPIIDPHFYEKMGIPTAAGVLLYGPPGCGKTLLAKAVANESASSFISIKGPELLNKYVGESERAVRALFSRSKAAAPCLLFFDEVDALAPKRSGSENQVTERVVNQLLTEMDGIDSRKGLYIIAATNRPDIIDPALIRPGRLEKILQVPLPSPEGRASILKTHGKMLRIAPDVDLLELALRQKLDGFSGADLKALVQNACLISAKEYFYKSVIHNELADIGFLPVAQLWHFDIALSSLNLSTHLTDSLTY